jgi:N-acetylglucosaminyldiphosphoundecaprenol N-acetyl-beta-D-mannosaminyltransferase
MHPGNINLDTRRTSFFDLPFFYRLTNEEAVSVIDGFIRSGTPHRVTVVNAARIIGCRQNPMLWQIAATADLVLNDGMGMMYASRLLGRPLPENLSGPLMMMRLVGLAAERGYSVYFLGAKPEMVHRAVKNFLEKYPALKVAGYHDGYFSSREEPEIVRKIREAHPEILLVAMGSPREELFIYKHMQEMGVPLCLDLGGAFDVAAGMTRLAPKWMRVAGLEWLYRVIQEPGRLWRRYLTVIPWFVFLVLRQLVHEQSAPARIKNRECQ